MRELAASPGAAVTARQPEFDRRIEQGRRTLETVFARSGPQRIVAGRTVIGPNDAGDLVYRLSCGWAYRAVAWPDGRRAIVDIYLPGDIIGLEAAVSERPLYEVVALTALSARAIDAAALSELMATPSAAAAVLSLLAEQQRRIDRLAAALARRDAHERLALMLTDLYDRLCRRGLIVCASYALPLTQQQIGDHLGLTLVHVNRVLRSLREQNIVSVDRHVVTIRDLDRLRQLAASGKTAPRPLAEPPRERAEAEEMALS